MRVGRKKRVFPSIRALSSILRRSRQKESEQEAAVLAIIDPQQRILICRRSDDLRSHPGEACLAGGKREKGDKGHIGTALRETEEEIGLNRSLVSIKYELDPLHILPNIAIHTIVGTVAEVPQLSVNSDEVSETMWVPLESFLKKDLHWCIVYDNIDIHGFAFPQFEVFGLTANLCILIAIKEFGKAPEFDINSVLTTERMTTMTPSEIIRNFYKYYNANVRQFKKNIEVAKI